MQTISPPLAANLSIASLKQQPSASIARNLFNPFNSVNSFNLISISPLPNSLPAPPPRSLGTYLTHLTQLTHLTLSVSRPFRTHFLPRRLLQNLHPAACPDARRPRLHHPSQLRQRTHPARRLPPELLVAHDPAHQRHVFHRRPARAESRRGLHKIRPRLHRQLARPRLLFVRQQRRLQNHLALRAPVPARLHH